ncbi:sulfur carrier protein ThiS [Nakamurella leprariae]|uniref:Sulfur carrier protein ThiS n=1 Tax=Nakamurella leprariae TaxID=2803911 RepID=A0A939BUM6_9ACTN|nr:sulfur carrier protein ThiS [Nakamurella leprariae]MBM9465683.1 sulfur carrier protein ThiS [Nakamurella leprariae]
MITVTVNGERHQLDRGITVAGLLAVLDLPTEGVAVAIDAAVVPRARWASEVVDGAEVEVLSAVPGG